MAYVQILAGQFLHRMSLHEFTYLCGLSRQTGMLNSPGRLDESAGVKMAVQGLQLKNRAFA